MKLRIALGLSAAAVLAGCAVPVPMVYRSSTTSPSPAPSPAPSASPSGGAATPPVLIRRTPAPAPAPAPAAAPAPRPASTIAKAPAAPAPVVATAPVPTSPPPATPLVSAEPSGVMGQALNTPSPPVLRAEPVAPMAAPAVATAPASPATSPSAPATPGPVLTQGPVELGPTMPALDPAAAQAAQEALTAMALPADLWDRIRRGFAMPNLDSELVREREQWYATRPDYIQRMTERSRKYLFHVVEELERRNMPTELALLPYIESAFNPQAVSSARAAGMWQFIPSTGKDFALKQNVFRDDRRDVLASTRAALDYLQRLHDMFGDWHLALAAYNWGEGSVGRAIAKNQRQGLGSSYTELNMPAETRLYVPKLQAVKNIIAAPDRFGATLPVIENHPYFKSVPLARDIDVTLAAKLAEVRLEDFRALNPSAHRPVILAAGTPQILLPWDNAATFQRNLEAYESKHFASWTAWVAPATLKVADAAKRVGMSEGELRSMNNIPPGMMIKAGSTLLVPRPARQQNDVTEHVADNGQIALAPEVVLRRSLVKAGRRDTVASLARRYGVSPAKVADWNDVSPNASFKAGQRVVMFLPVRAGSGQAVAATHVDSAPPAKHEGVVRVSAKAADTHSAPAAHSHGPATRVSGANKAASARTGKPQGMARASAPAATKSAAGKPATRQAAVPRQTPQAKPYKVARH